MTPDPDRPETLLSVPTEIEAEVIVTALAEYGIKALAVGGCTSGFKAEAPGLVAVVVKHADVDRAKQALAEIRPQGRNKEASVGPRRWTIFKMIVNYYLWISILLGIVISWVTWLATGEIDSLVNVIIAVLLVGLILALSRHAMRRH